MDFVEASAFAICLVAVGVGLIVLVVHGWKRGHRDEDDTVRNARVRLPYMKDVKVTGVMPDQPLPEVQPGPAGVGVNFTPHPLDDPLGELIKAVGRVGWERGSYGCVRIIIEEPDGEGYAMNDDVVGVYVHAFGTADVIRRRRCG